MTGDGERIGLSDPSKCYLGMVNMALALPHLAQSSPPPENPDCKMPKKWWKNHHLSALLSPLLDLPIHHWQLPQVSLRWQAPCDDFISVTGHFGETERGHDLWFRHSKIGSISVFLCIFLRESTSLGWKHMGSYQENSITRGLTIPRNWVCELQAIMDCDKQCIG